jgi:16S rRNA G966 N2-methylase RsmD
MITKSFKWHPQPSSVRKSTAAAKNAHIRGAVILDCFCGGGSHAVASIQAGAKKFVGTDLEDFSFCLRKDIARFNGAYTTFEDEQAVTFEWGIDAQDSIRSHKYDILFIDPPNPLQIVGGATKSVIRDTGLSGSKLTKFWKSHLNEKNLINKRDETIKTVEEIVSESLSQGKRVIANLFTIKSNGFDYHKRFCEDGFKSDLIFESYYEVNR